MITCWLYRRFSSSAVDSNTPLPEWARQHAESCPACREYQEVALAMARRLAISAEAERRTPSPFLQGRIMAAIRAEEKVKTQPARANFGWGIAAATACLLFLTGFLVTRKPATPSQNGFRAQAASTELALNVSFPTAAQVELWTKSLDQPLETETQLVLNDAKAAINSLKSSFLPERLLAAVPERTMR